MDLLTIKGFAVSTAIGIHAWEKQIKQRLLIDITIHADFADCRDDINRTIDYDKLCQSVRERIEKKSFNLIETVANEIAEYLKTTFSITALTVSVSKPQALAHVQNVMVSVSR